MTTVPVHPRKRFRIEKRALRKGGPLRWVLIDRKVHDTWAVGSWLMAWALVDAILNYERGD